MKIIPMIGVVILGCFLASQVDADTLTFEMTAGANENITGNSVSWEDQDGIGATLEVKYTKDLSDHWYVLGKIVHVSQWDIGWPFNNQPESSVDHFGLGIGYKFF